MVSRLNMKIFNQIKHLLMLSSGQLRILGLCLFSPSPLGEGRGEGLSVPIVILYVTLNRRLNMATPAKKLIAAAILASVATLALYGCISSSGPHAVNSTQVQNTGIPGTGPTVY